MRIVNILFGVAMLAAVPLILWYSQAQKPLVPRPQSLNVAALTAIPIAAFGVLIIIRAIRKP